VTAPNGVESSTANPDDPHEVPFVWKVKAVGVESEAWKYWDHPKYEDPDLINNFGVWLGDAIDKDVDFIKVSSIINVKSVSSSGMFRRESPILELNRCCCATGSGVSEARIGWVRSTRGKRLR
jgi:hypothetical protein